MPSMRGPFENTLWIIGATLVALGAIGSLRVVIICGTILMACVFGYKTIQKKRMKSDV